MNGNIEHRKLKNGSYSYIFTVSAGTDKLTGERNRVRKTIKSPVPIGKRDLNSQLNEFHKSVMLGEYVKDNAQTISDLLDEWLESQKISKSIRIKTLGGYTQVSNDYLKTYLGKLKIAELKAEYIEKGIGLISKHKGTRIKKQLSDRTVFTCYRVLNACLNWATKRDIIPSNPMNKLSPPKYIKKEPKTISNKDFNKVILYLSDHSDWTVAPVSLLLRTGAREGEILGLKWGDIDFDNNMLSIQRTVSQINATSEMMIEPTKTVKSRRSVFLGHDDLEILRQRRDQQLNEVKQINEKLKDSDFIFGWLTEDVKEWGLYKPYVPASLGQAYRRACKHYGIDSSVHKLRHTHATVLLKKNINPKIVQERLGHASITTTMDIYSHALPTMQQGAVESFGQFLIENKEV
tara:strand:+ start:3184 stop:4398 length:1215 start_codon:yes stop_codon:yes gene_type:complete